MDINEIIRLTKTVERKRDELATAEQALAAAVTSKAAPKTTVRVSAKAAKPAPEKKRTRGPTRVRSAEVAEFVNACGHAVNADIARRGLKLAPRFTKNVSTTLGLLATTGKILRVGEGMYERLPLRNGHDTIAAVQ